MENRFKVDDKVLVLHPQPRFGAEVPPTPATIARVEPYRHRSGHVTVGYYVTYPNAREQWECHGGWVPESILRGTCESKLV